MRPLSTRADPYSLLTSLPAGLSLITIEGSVLGLQLRFTISRYLFLTLFSSLEQFASSTYSNSGNGKKTKVVEPLS